MISPGCNRAVLTVLATTILHHFADAKNLTCYQCTRTTNTPCTPEELLPCPSNSDRCVTHIVKDKDNGYKIKRECGLAPCTFNNSLMNKGLGLDTCDRSRDEYFCVFCCRDDGCNKNSTSSRKPCGLFVLFCVAVLLVLNVFRDYQPPYFPKRNS